MLGADIVGYALDPKTEKDNYVLSNLNESIIEYRADIRDKNRIIKVVKNEKPEIIFHFAAQPLVLESYKNPLETFETNTQGTVNILEAFRLSESAKLLIIVTTDKVYENRNWDWGYRENDPLGGKDPYSASKCSAEIITKSYYESFFKNSDKRVVTVRAGNVIGGGDWSENRIVPDCIKALEQNKPILIRNPGAKRPWQHVLEALSGYLLLGDKILKNEIKDDLAWNFGPCVIDGGITVESLAKEIIKSYGSGTYEIKAGDCTRKEAVNLSLDISKAVHKLNWKPILDLKTTINFTIEWYKYYQCRDVKRLCETQIGDYERIWRSRN